MVAVIPLEGRLDDLRSAWTFRTLAGAPAEPPEGTEALLEETLVPGLREALMGGYEGGFIRSADMYCWVDRFGAVVPRMVGELRVTMPSSRVPEGLIGAVAEIRGGTVSVSGVRRCRRVMSGLDGLGSWRPAESMRAPFFGIEDDLTEDGGWR